jgi:N-acyl-D-amino-acid deacylase
MRFVTKLLGYASIIPCIFVSHNLNAQNAPINAIIGAKIIDGTGKKARIGNIRFQNGRIICVNKCEIQANDIKTDGKGLVLAPGFIDTHSHHDRHIDIRPDASVAISQGVTTIVVGEDGDSALPLSVFFDARKTNPAAINIASYVGHGAVRSAIMGDDYKRPATDVEIKKMQDLVAGAMNEGALGLSTGLEYDPGIYSEPKEVIALAQTAAKYNGRYISHIRSEDIAIDEAIDEVIEIGRQAKLPVQISHLKIAMIDKWGQADKIIQKLEKARKEGIDISADVYPYTFWQSSLDVLLPNRDFTDRKAAQFALLHLAKPQDLIITNFPPDQSYIGKSIADIAKLRNKDEITTYLDLNIEAQAAGKGSGVMGRAMAQDDVAKFIGWKHSNICSDGRIIDRHPRGAGSFTRVISWLVKGEKQLSLEQAIYKMTNLSAAHMGIKDRGKIAKNMAADLVLFDEKIIKDMATLENPSAQAVGVSKVWVNGVLVFANGKATDARPGQIIRHKIK